MLSDKHPILMSWSETLIRFLKINVTYILSKVKPIEQLITLKVIHARKGTGLLLLECKEPHHNNSIPPVRAIILAVNAVLLMFY